MIDNTSDRMPTVCSMHANRYVAMTDDDLRERILYGKRTTACLTRWNLIQCTQEKKNHKNAREIKNEQKCIRWMEEKTQLFFNQFFNFNKMLSVLTMSCLQEIQFIYQFLNSPSWQFIITYFQQWQID